MLNVVRQLENDPTDKLAAVLARLGRSIEEAKTSAFTETASQAEKHPDS